MFDENGHFFVVHGSLALNLDHCFVRHPRCCIDPRTTPRAWVGRTVGIDATTLDANAAMRSIVRRDTGESDDAFLTRLAEASGLSTPTRAELARFDRTRKKKGSNDDWTHPHDPDAKIAKMKDGRTHLAHTAEHAVGHRAEGARVSVAAGA